MGLKEKCLRTEDINVRLLMIVCALILFSLNLIRAFDVNYWCDEAFSYLMSLKSIPEIVYATAMDMHPPLYYLYLNIFCDLFGHSGPALHISTLVPYALILYVAYSRIYKRFGLAPALMMMVFASILPISVRYNADIRMYIWISLFMLLAYLEFYDILENTEGKHLKWFAIYSLLAAYTHYYCTIAIGILCLILLLIYRKDAERMPSVKRTIKIMIIAYLPWVIVLLRAFIIASTNFWIEDIPTIFDCLLFLFDGKASVILVSLMFISLGAVIAYDAVKKKSLSNFSIWMIAGIATILVSAIIGIVVSHVIAPMYLVRYSFFSITIAWLILSLCITRMNSKTLKALVTIGILSIVLIASVPEYCDIYENEKESNEATERTLELTKDISNRDVILTNVNGIKNDVVSAYYSCSRIVIEVDDLPDLDTDTRYWMFIENSITPDTVTNLNAKGFNYELITNDGCLGSVNDPSGDMHYLPGNKCHIYRLVPL